MKNLITVLVLALATLNISCSKEELVAEVKQPEPVEEVKTFIGTWKPMEMRNNDKDYILYPEFPNYESLHYKIWSNNDVTFSTEQRWILFPWRTLEGFEILDIFIHWEEQPNGKVDSDFNDMYFMYDEARDVLTGYNVPYWYLKRADKIVYQRI